MDKSQRTFTNRRHLLKGGAALSGAAVVAAGLSPHTAMAQEASQSRLQQVLDRGKLVVGTGNGHNGSSSSSRRRTHASRTLSPTRSTSSASS
ncbi:MAG: hypothetical protein K0Q71_5440 [Thermomicrobiales bacterium]|nr:hypothetical protein [Thermomicrobiales bacterium]